MILEDVLCTLRTRLLDSGFIKEFYELTEMFTRGEVTAPGFYEGNGQYKHVHDFDINGAGYARKRGDVYIQLDASKGDMVACSSDDFLILNYPMRAVIAVPKIHLGDNAYSDDRLFAEMAVIFAGDYSASRVQDISTSIQGYSTDALSIWKQEVSGIDYQMNPRLSYIAIDFNLTFSVTKSCLPEVCGYGY